MEALILATPSVLRLADVTLNPKPSALPGSGTLQHLANGLAGWALVLSLFILYFGERASPGAAQAAVYGAAVGAFLTRLALIIRKISAPAFRGTSTPATLDDH